MFGRKTAALEFGFLLLFHATVSGAFLVAYFSGDEDTYGIHVVAGYAVAAALALRLIAALLAPAGSVLAWPRPRFDALADWTRRLVRGEPRARRQRSPLFAFMAVIVLAAATLATTSGIGADFLPDLEDLHEGLSEFALWIAAAHVATVLALQLLKPRPGASRGAAAVGETPVR